MVRCNACNATYESIPADGVRYFHACAPLSDAEVTVALALPADPATWTAPQKAQFAAAPRARPGARDENVTTALRNSKTGVFDQPGTPKADGAGTTKL